jgi:hypothetical protein
MSPLNRIMFKSKNWPRQISVSYIKRFDSCNPITLCSSLARAKKRPATFEHPFRTYVGFSFHAAHKNIYAVPVDYPGFESSQKQESFLFFKRYRLDLHPTQPPIQWAPGFFLRGKAARA